MYCGPWALLITCEGIIIIIIIIFLLLSLRQLYWWRVFQTAKRKWCHLAWRRTSKLWGQRCCLVRNCVCVCVCVFRPGEGMSFEETCDNVPVPTKPIMWLFFMGTVGSSGGEFQMCDFPFNLHFHKVNCECLPHFIIVIFSSNWLETG